MPGHEPVSDGVIQNPRLQRLHAQWLAWKGDLALPSRADFLPEDIGYLLGHVILFDVVAGERLRFRYRLIGTVLVARRGYDLTGRFLDEHPDAGVTSIVTEINERVVREARPLWWGFDARGQDKRMRHCEVLTLPLTRRDMDPAAGVTMLLAAQIFTDEERARR